MGTSRTSTSRTFRLGPLDALYVYTDSAAPDDTPNIVTDLYVFDTRLGCAVENNETAERWLAERIDRIPTLSRRLHRVPADLDHPYWIESEVSPADHLRFSRIGVTTRRELHRHIAAIAERPVDFSRPPWEIHVLADVRGVADLPEGATVVTVRAHHSVTDGSGLIRIARMLFDDPDVEYSTNLHPAGIRGPVRAALGLPAGVARFLRADRRAKTAQQVLAVEAAEGNVVLPGPRPRTRFNRVEDGTRQFGRITLDLNEVRSLARGAGVSVNDVALTIVSGALSRFLELHDEVPSASLAAQVPRALDDREDLESENRATVMMVDLHTDQVDPLERLQRIHRSAVLEKRRVELPETSAGSTALIECPAFLVSRMFRKAAAGTGDAAPVVNTVVSNTARGVPDGLRFGGSPAVLGFSAPCLNRASGLMHMVTSLGDVLSLTFSSKEASMPDPDEYERLLVASFGELRDV